MFDNFSHMRSAGEVIGDAVLRSLEETGELSIRGMRAAGFRALAPLMDKAQVYIDKAVVNVGRQRLTFVNDLITEGLSIDLPDPLSYTQYEYSKTNRVGAAQRVMNPSSRKENKLPSVLPSRLPIYLTTDGFELDIRTLKQSQRLGTPLDVTLAEACTRSVNEGLEDAAINGATTLDGQNLVVAGYSAPGLLNAPGANAQTITTAAWNGTTPNGATVLAETMAMIAKLQADLKYGPYNLYVGTAIGLGLANDFKANGTDTIMQRLLAMDIGGTRGLRIRVADMMPANTVALIQMTSDVVGLINGQPPTVIPWTSADGFQIHNLVMAIMIPMFRSDYSGNSGVVVGS